MFARVQVLLPEQKDVLVVPATSVLRAPSGDSVYLIESSGTSNAPNAELKVRQQLVRLGLERGDFVSVESGLKAGDRIVSAGQFKLRTGMAVVEENSIAPKTEKSPRPSES
jgi:membrane fusion protein (multidrug efflux system)